MINVTVPSNCMPDALAPTPPPDRRPRLVPTTGNTRAEPHRTRVVYVPLFKPAEARRLARAHDSTQRIAIHLEPAPERDRPHPLVALDRCDKRHGRRTRKERRDHYALDPRAVVTIYINGTVAPRRDAREEPTGDRVAS